MSEIELPVDILFLPEGRAGPHERRLVPLARCRVIEVVAQKRRLPGERVVAMIYDFISFYARLYPKPRRLHFYC